MVLVRAAVPDDWRALSDIRLQALQEAPDAFSSTYAEQVKFGEADWRERIARGGTFLADLPGDSASVPAGMVGGYFQLPGQVELISMYVRPWARGRGVGDALFGAVIDWAGDKDATVAHLWVTETNEHARRLYERCGFTETAEREPLPSNLALYEIGMIRPLDPMAQ